MTIFTERPIYKSVTLFNRQLTPILQMRTVNHTGEENIAIKFEEAKAYSFRTYGKGRYVVQYRSSAQSFDFSKSGELHRGFLDGYGFLRFIGEHSYTVCDLAIFDELLGESIEDIPTLSDFSEYDMSKLCEDFLSFVSLPTDEYGTIIEGSTLCGSTLTVPSSHTGRINLTYKAAPKKLSGKPGEQITLPHGCEHLPALLASAYVWLDDDADKAQYYMSLYREAMSAVKYYDREKIDNKYYDVNGWA